MLSFLFFSINLLKMFDKLGMAIERINNILADANRVL
jgi:hypothetical protein